MAGHVVDGARGHNIGPLQFARSLRFEAQTLGDDLFHHLKVEGVVIRVKSIRGFITSFAPPYIFITLCVRVVKVDYYVNY